MHSRNERGTLEQELAKLLKKLSDSEEADKAVLKHKIVTCNDALFLTYIREIIYNNGFWRQQGTNFTVYKGLPAAIETLRSTYEKNIDKDITYQACCIGLLSWNENADRSHSIIGSLNRAIQLTRDLSNTPGDKDWPKNINMKKMERFIERYMPTVVKQAPEPASSFHPFDNL